MELSNKSAGIESVSHPNFIPGFSNFLYEELFALICKTIGYYRCQFAKADGFSTAIKLNLYKAVDFSSFIGT